MSKSSPVDRDTAGPFDISEIGVLTPYLDFGSIRLAPRQDMQIRADIDDTSKKVVALTVEIEGHRLQLQAFASTKSDGLWEATMSALIQGIASQGGSVEPVEGILGQELRGSVPAKSGDKTISRPTRFIGVDGPRWFLEESFLPPQLVRTFMLALCRHFAQLRSVAETLQCLRANSCR